MSKVLFSSFQAGDFFYSTRSSATAQQREIEAHSISEESVDTPLLLEQVQTAATVLYS